MVAHFPSRPSSRFGWHRDSCRAERKPSPATKAVPATDFIAAERKSTEVPSVIRSTRLDGRAELSVQVVDLRVRYGPACVAELATLSAKRPVSTTVSRCSWSICPLRETCYFAPNICSSPPSWLDRQRAAPFQGTGHQWTCAPRHGEARVREWNIGAVTTGLIPA